MPRKKKQRVLKSVEGHIAARQRKKSKRGETPELSLDRDDIFAYIAGYTEAGFAFGVTWEEWEQLNQQHLSESKSGVEASTISHKW